MIRLVRGTAVLLAMAAAAQAQQCNCGPHGQGAFGPAFGGEVVTYGGPVGGYGPGLAGAGLIDGGFGGMEYIGSGSIGASEPLFDYEDRESWKHGYQQVMPFYGGYHAGRPYNYHHVFAQTQTSVGWGMPRGMAYSQQWWHRYEKMADPGRAETEADFLPPELPEGPVNAYPSPSLTPTPAFPSPQPITSAPLAVFQGVAPVQFQSIAPTKVFRGNAPPQF